MRLKKLNLGAVVFLKTHTHCVVLASTYCSRTCRNAKWLDSAGFCWTEVIYIGVVNWCDIYVCVVTLPRNPFWGKWKPWGLEPKADNILLGLIVTWQSLLLSRERANQYWIIDIAHNLTTQVAPGVWGPRYPKYKIKIITNKHIGKWIIICKSFAS